jgi:hypothetical protein
LVSEPFDPVGDSARDIIMDLRDLLGTEILISEFCGFVPEESHETSDFESRFFNHHQERIEFFDLEVNHSEG